MRTPPVLWSPIAARGALIGVPLALASFGYLASVQFIPVSLATLIFFTYPMGIAVLARLSGTEKLSWAQFSALVLAFLGVALTVGTDHHQIDARGVALALLASISVALAIHFSGPFMRAIGAMNANFYMMSTSVLGFGFWMALAHGFQMPTTASGAVGLFGGGFIYIFAVASFFLAVHLIGAVRTALVNNLEPVVSLVAAFALLQERLSLVQYLGGVLILCALAFMQWHDRRVRAMTA
ncbi:MAG: DMT family transporter [Alphaproteobacteria bacterium]|nr:DMT family transporter [Alphaproteobacteria bacterium]